jgi:serine O-acetyltransferase
VCGYGLSLPHYGSIVINANCKIGENCRIQNNVNIGAPGGSNKAPIIGNNVYIGPGAVIYGDIVIADNCYIGANAVVNKSFTEPYSVIAGVPAKLVKIEERAWNEK